MENLFEKTEQCWKLINAVQFEPDQVKLVHAQKSIKEEIKVS